MEAADYNASSQWTPSFQLATNVYSTCIRRYSLDILCKALGTKLVVIAEYVTNTIPANHGHSLTY